MTYKSELIQVAAVALAAIENEEYGCTCSDAVRAEILLDIEAERDRQNARWGCCDHRRDIWMLILVEEVGECAKAIIEDNDNALAEKHTLEIALGAAPQFDPRKEVPTDPADGNADIPQKDVMGTFTV